jgi:hypothetical protein
VQIYILCRQLVLLLATFIAWAHKDDGARWIDAD